MLSEDPALVILDINMPRLDGYGFCTHDKSIALETLGKEMGAYLQKPISEEKLLEVVESQLAKGAIV